MGKEIWSIYNANISGYEHSTRKDNITYSLFVCPLWFVVFSAAFGLRFHHCYSCYKTELRSHKVCFALPRDVSFEDLWYMFTDGRGPWGRFNTVSTLTKGVFSTLILFFWR